MLTRHLKLMNLVSGKNMINSEKNEGKKGVALPTCSLKHHWFLLLFLERSQFSQ